MLSSGWQRGPAQRFLGPGVIVALFATSACSVIVDASRDQCATNGDCARKGGAFAKSVCTNSVCVPEVKPDADVDPRWSCVGKVPSWSTGTTTPTTEKVTAKVTFSNLLTKATVSGVTVRVCGKLDPTCASPLQSGVMGDDQGLLTLELDRYFDGYLEIRHPQMVDTMYFFNPPVDANRVIPFVLLVPPEAITVFSEQLKMQPRFDRGVVIALAYDCNGEPAEGVELSVDGADEFTAPFYMAAGFPSLDATRTDKSGQGGIANVVAGPRQVSGRLSENGLHFGTVSVQSRAPQITYTSMLPTPITGPSN